MISTVGLLIFFAVVAGVFCMNAGSTSGAALFLSMALLLFVHTPAGKSLPGDVAGALRAINAVVSPALNHAGDPHTQPSPTPSRRPGR